MWKRITDLNLVPPGDSEPAPFTRKQKLQALREKSRKMLRTITQTMSISDLHQDRVWDIWAIPHFLENHPDYVEKGLIVRKGSKWTIPDEGRLVEAHLTDSSHRPEESSVVSINAHTHAGRPNPLDDPLLEEYSKNQRAILELEGKIPKEPK